MTLYKKGTYASSVIVSSSVYLCGSCGYSNVYKDTSDEKKCPHCGTILHIISSHAAGNERKESANQIR